MTASRTTARGRWFRARGVIDLSRDPQAMRITEWAGALAARFGAEVEVVWRRGACPHTEWVGERATIVLPPSLRDRPEDHRRFTVAHEVGHVVLCAQAIMSEVVRRQLWRFAARLVVIAGLAAIATIMVPRAGFLAMTAGVYAAALALRPAVRAVHQPGEFAADAFAAAHGAVLTADLAARRAAEERLAGRFSLWLYPTHPSWPDRRRAVRDAGQGDGRLMR